MPVSVNVDAYVPAYVGRILTTAGAPVGTCCQVAPGILVTAWHVLDAIGAGAEGDPVPVDTLAGHGAATTATVLRTDPRHDVAVLRSPRPFAESIAIARSDDEPSTGAVWVTGVSDVYDHTSYRFLNAHGNWAGGALRDDGALLRRMRNKDLVPGMSGAPVVRATVPGGAVLVGVVSSRYNSRVLQVHTRYQD